MRVTRTITPAYVGSVRRFLPRYLASLRAAIWEEARLVALGDYALALLVAEATYETLMSALHEADYVVVSHDNGESDQVLVYLPKKDVFAPNYKRIYRTAQACMAKLTALPA